MTTHAQTEARAIQRYIAPSAGRGAVVQLLKHCDGEWVRHEDHIAALAAKDAELAEVHQRYVDANEARIDAEARRAEALKALEPFASMGELLKVETEGFSDTDEFDLIFGDHLFHHFTAGHFRAALAAKDTATEYASELHTVRAQIAEARKALEPFANATGHFDGHVRDDDDVSIALRDIKARHLRAARRALEAQGGENAE